MAKGGIIATFVSTILFGIIAPTSDVSSDVKLLIDVVTFQVGHDWELTGCRSCYGLSTDEVYQPKVGSCHTCMSSPKTLYFNPSFSCGENVDINEKFRKLKEDSTCKRRTWGFGHEDRCNTGDLCCIHKTNRSRTSSQYTPFDVRRRPYFCQILQFTETNFCQMCNHAGMASSLYCEKLLQQWHEQDPMWMSKVIETGCNNTYYKINRNFSNNSMNVTITSEV